MSRKCRPIFVVLVLSLSIQAFAQTVENSYKGLSMGPLRQAKLVVMPKGTLLQAGEVRVSEQEVNAEIAKASPAMQPQLNKNRFFVLEQVATQRLLLAEATVWAARQKGDTAKAKGDTLTRLYLDSFADSATVSANEMQAFYAENREMFGGASFATVSIELKSYLIGQKRQALVTRHIIELSIRNSVQVNSEWLKANAAAALNNPVDKARRSGKPSMVDFGADGCRPCEMMTPILAELRKTYADKCNVLFTHVRQEQVLAACYSIQSIPVQVFFDRNGNEVSRHVGFYPKAQILAKFKTLAVK